MTKINAMHQGVQQIKVSSLALTPLTFFINKKIDATLRTGRSNIVADEMYGLFIVLPAVGAKWLRVISLVIEWSMKFHFIV